MGLTARSIDRDETVTATVFGTTDAAFAAAVTGPAAGGFQPQWEAIDLISVATTTRQLAQNPAHLPRQRVLGALPESTHNALFCRRSRVRSCR
jgi:hypothetical protein